MIPPRLVVLSRRGEDALLPEHWTEIRQFAHTTAVRTDTAPDPDAAARLLADADLLGATNLCLPRIDADLLDALPRLRGIVLYATGYDHLDVRLLRSRGVGLSVLPDYATTAVAEHCLAMLLSLATRLHLANDRSRDRVGPGVSLRGVELAGRTLGIVGVGRIGGAVARRARALGMDVIGTDPDPGAVSRARADGFSMVEPERLLDHAHAVAVCANHSHGAAPLLGRAELAGMRPGALLVNVARSALVDTEAAVEYVRSGRLRGYAVDDTVLDPDRHTDVLAEGRVLQTGHSAWWRDETLDRGARMWGERLLAAVRGRPGDAVTWPGRTGGPCDGRTEALGGRAGSSAREVTPEVVV
ncbi:2-hydroxyacid dehydrogenase [Nocardiopsis sp. NPDC050513]|uniref:2-hydroxyacid dehydrogenase n=1 Tax=Nocardiopsis sp. NPDC050513 TaxID=3364338 RepID=UPI0037AEFEBB